MPGRDRGRVLRADAPRWRGRNGGPSAAADWHGAPPRTPGARRLHAPGDPRSSPVSRNDRSGTPLRVKHLRPERDRAQPCESGIVEIGPREGLGVVSVMARDKLIAEPLLVLLGADLHDGDAALPRHRGRRWATRMR